MSDLGDMFDFELFNLKDMWGKIEDNPMRLLYGGMEPFSTGMWNTILGRDDEPLMNQLGGPMGGDTLGIGSGGVYDRAEEEGIRTGPSMLSHDVAEVIASYYGGSALANLAQGGAGAAGAAEGGAAAGGGAGAGAGAGGGSATTFALPETGSLGGGEFINAAGEPIAGGGGGMFGEGGMFDFGNMGWQDYMQMMPQGGGQQQQQPQPRPMPQFAGGGGGGGVAPAMGMPETFTPSPRAVPFGLLGDEEEEMMMRATMGGLL